MLENCSWPGQLLGKLNAPPASISKPWNWALTHARHYAKCFIRVLSILTIIKGKHLHFARKDLLTSQAWEMIEPNSKQRQSNCKAHILSIRNSSPYVPNFQKGEVRFKWFWQQKWKDETQNICSLGVVCATEDSLTIHTVWWPKRLQTIKYSWKTQKRAWTNGKTCHIRGIALPGIKTHS